MLKPFHICGLSIVSFVPLQGAIVQFKCVQTIWAEGLFWLNISERLYLLFKGMFQMNTASDVQLMFC